MRVQVLVAAMHQTDRSLPEKMNIQSDAIIGNQCDREEVASFDLDGHRITYVSTPLRGLSCNRNTALIRADADVCLLADDDMTYDDGYVETVRRAYEELPDADVIIFNINEPVKTRYVTPETTKVGWLNYLRYGSARISFRLSPIRENAISFNQCFGAGTERGFGEDNLFLTACLRNKLRVYAVPTAIATLTEERESTWFKGYDRTYLRNKGLLFRAISRRWYRLLCLQDALRHHGKYKLSFFAAYKAMIRPNAE